MINDMYIETSHSNQNPTEILDIIKNISVTAKKVKRYR